LSRSLSPNQSGAPLKSSSRTGGPFGSTARLTVTRSGRLSTIGQAKAPDCECVSRIEGPIFSSNAMIAGGLISCCLAKFASEGNCEK